MALTTSMERYGEHLLELDVSALLADHVVFSQGRDLPTLTIEARMWTPELAADVANRLAEKIVERAAKIGAPTVAVMRAQSDAAKTKLKAAADALASASGEYKAIDGMVMLPRQRGANGLLSGATDGAWQAPRDSARYSAFVDAVGDYEVAMRIFTN